MDWATAFSILLVLHTKLGCFTLTHPHPVRHIPTPMITCAVAAYCLCQRITTHDASSKLGSYRSDAKHDDTAKLSQSQVLEVLRRTAPYVTEVAVA